MPNALYRAIIRPQPSLSFFLSSLIELKLIHTATIPLLHLESLRLYHITYISDD